jgi:pilus assembly protein CpaB
MRFVLLLVAAVIAVVAGVAALQFSGKTQPSTLTAGTAEPRPAGSSDVSTVEVLVARTPISMGTVLDETMIDKQPWPEHLVLEGFITATGPDASLVGKVARAPLAEREPFMKNKIANPNDPSFLAASLPTGMRAITIATDAISGVAGYVFPGDRVDILITHNIPQEISTKRKLGMTNNKPEIAEVLVPNVRVLAVNVRTPSGKEAQANTVPSSVTVELGPRAAQAVRLAEKNGTLSLALRSIQDQERKGLPQVTPVQTLSRGSHGDAGIRIVRGAGDKNDAMGASVTPGASLETMPTEDAGPTAEPVNP